MSSERIGWYATMMWCGGALGGNGFATLFGPVPAFVVLSALLAFCAWRVYRLGDRESRARVNGHSSTR
jgi:hypothetical protein